MADGSYRWQGQAPTPDAARVEAIDAAYDEAQSDAWAEPARAAVIARIGQALTAARVGDPGVAAARLADARSVLTGLNPAALEPRRGLTGLFDSRNRRLRDFRATFHRAAAALAEVARDLSERVENATRRSGGFDEIWSGLRDAMVDLDAHLIAAARRLSGHMSGEDATAHPLEGRSATLDACRAAALGALPLIRNAQNADARAAEALKACSEGVAVWRDGWREALGLAGKRPKRVRPDADRLLALRDDLLARIDRAAAELTASHTRRAGVEARFVDLSGSL